MGGAISLTTVLVVVLIVGLVTLLLGLTGGHRTMLSVFIVTVAIYPKLLTSGLPTKHVGIAGEIPSLSSYSLWLLIALGFVVLIGKLPRSVFLFVPFVLFLAIGISFIWGGTGEQWAGVLQLLLAPAAWAMGAYCVRKGNASLKWVRFLAALIMCVMLLQTAVCLLQMAGVPVNPMEASQEALLPGRFNGTLVHPNDLGKIVVILLGILLPFARYSDTIIRRLAVCAFSFGFCVLALTGGRAVFVGCLAMVLISALLSPRARGEISRKWLAVFGCMIVGLIFSGVLVSRWEEDPAGGARSGLVDLALHQIGANFTTGVGPNSYVSVVGRFDALTASGVPVHNSFLLALAELGFFGLLCMLIPVIALVVKCVRLVLRPSIAGDFARAGLAFFPALYLIGSTGWGLLGSYVLPALFFFFGFIFTGLSVDANVRDPGLLTQGESVGTTCL